MKWFHTVALPLATVLAVYFGVKRNAPAWKHGALLLGCGLMLAGLWLGQGSTFLLIGGGLVFFLGLSRGPEIRQVAPVRAPAVGEAGTGGIHISFPSPGFFVGDAQVALLLDGTTVYEGSFKAGIDVTVSAAPGPHRLESAIEGGIAKRRQSWDIEVPTSGCEVTLEYSRMWGNFDKRVRVGSTGA